MIWYMTWYTIRYDDMTWYTIGYDMLWYDTMIYDTRRDNRNDMLYQFISIGFPPGGSGQ